MPGSVYIVLFLLFSLSVFNPVKASEKKPGLSSENYVLILSSYQYNNPYTTSIAKQIQQQLEKENPSLVFRTVYASLDAQKTMLASRLNMQKAFSQARLTPTVLIPKILVLIGDESWMLYRIMNLRGKWGKVPVVLCGVNNRILKDYSTFFTNSLWADSLFIPLDQSTKNLQVTGVLRDNVSDKTAKFIHTTFPALKEIVYISEGNYKDEYAWQEQRRSLATLLPKVKISYFNSSSVSPDSICRYANQLSADSSAVLFNTSPSFLSSIHLPAYALQDGGRENNKVAGGYYTTAGQLARQTARLILRIYNGIPVHDLPFQYVQKHHFYVNDQAPYLKISRSTSGKLSNLVCYNTPAPFFIRHLRIITLIFFILFIPFISCLIYRRTQNYQRYIEKLYWKYKELHENFRIIYDNMPVALMIFNEHGKLLLNNPRMQELWQTWHQQQPYQLNLFRDLVPASTLQEKILRRENINQVVSLQDGKYQSHSTGTDPDMCHYYRLVVRYIPDEIQNTDNILILLIDNTAIYREKILHKRLRSIFNFAMNKADIGFAEFNLYDQTGMATDSWRKHLGLQQKQHTDYPALSRHIDAKDRETLRQFFNRIYQGQSKHFSGEIKIIRDNHTVHYLREQIQVMEYEPENGQIRVAELNQNIDNEKQIASEIEAATQKAQEAERLKNTFIANMSHEIRSPLNAIVGFSNLMLNTRDIETRQEMIRHIEASNETLLRLVNDIIDLSKIESGSMTFEFSETDVNALLRDITAIHQLKASQKNLQVECLCPFEELHIQTDKIRIRQVISNFLGNAIKFTEQGKITVGYRLNKANLYLYVADTGIGISKDQCDHIFNRFYRANRTYQGYGLGLSISQAMIEGLNGKIGVESEEGKGSTFWIDLPVKILKYAESPASPCVQTVGKLPSSLNRKPHLLIVEDDSSNFLLLHFMLKHSFSITHAWNGEEAVKLYREICPDLILMDIKMPKKNGYEATREIRAISCDVPIIATTAYAFSKDEAKALNNGFNAYLAKPLDKQLLLETINHWLNYAHQAH